MPEPGVTPQRTVTTPDTRSAHGGHRQRSAVPDGAHVSRGTSGTQRPRYARTRPLPSRGPGRNKPPRPALVVHVRACNVARRVDSEYTSGPCVRDVHSSERYSVVHEPMYDPRCILKYA